MVADGIQPPPSPPSSIQLPATPPPLPSVHVAAELPIVPVAAEPVHVKAEGNPSVLKRMKLEHQGLPRNNVAVAKNNQVVDLTGDDSADDKAGGMSDLDIRKEACRQVKAWKSQLGDQYMAAVNLLSQGRYAHSFLAVDPTDQEDWLRWSLQQGQVKREQAIKGE
ncbi:hypothetical protein AaE_016105 [Aphanomyces astaci]|uniref:Uncharacterized protein n=1 Tax=Aphanomyces astaci TaxID=112090 RepID=A0A6A4Z528_APHAT|nr:hypothetical protein AaE_016105 [Aphanomyces astaci]